MSIPKNPFTKSTAIPGNGEIVLSLLPLNKQVLTSFNYQYPLKLISPDAHVVTIPRPSHDNGEKELQFKQVQVTTVFLLTYGGGLIAGDSINLTVTLGSYTRLALLTQGSTKIFKTGSGVPKTSTVSSLVAQQSQPTRQILNVKISPHASLVYLPDPNQPFAQSLYEQRQTFYIDPAGSSNMLLLDWVSEGRKARGESWTLASWKGRNEVREFDEFSQGRLLIRDALLLFGDNLAAKTNGMGILGTLIIYGQLFKSLADFFMKEFRDSERIGAKNWTSLKASTGSTAVVQVGAEGQTGSVHEAEEEDRQHRLKADGLLWTAAQVRGFVLVKFGAKEADGARRWLGHMLKKDGTVEREFGHQALLCLK